MAHNVTFVIIDLLLSLLSPIYVSLLLSSFPQSISLSLFHFPHFSFLFYSLCEKIIGHLDKQTMRFSCFKKDNIYSLKGCSLEHMNDNGLSFSQAYLSRAREDRGHERTSSIETKRLCSIES